MIYAWQVYEEGEWNIIGVMIGGMQLPIITTRERVIHGYDDLAQQHHQKTGLPIRKVAYECEPTVLASTMTPEEEYEFYAKEEEEYEFYAKEENQTPIGPGRRRGETRTCDLRWFAPRIEKPDLAGVNHVCVEAENHTTEHRCSCGATTWADVERYQRSTDE